MLLDLLIAAFTGLALFLVYCLGHYDGVETGRQRTKERLRARLSRRTRGDWRGRSMALDVLPQHERN